VTTGAPARPLRILLVSQFYPGPEDPDLGVFVRELEVRLVARGNVVERAVLDRRGGGKRRFLTLARDTFLRARAFGPDVVYAHFLVPTGLIAAVAGRAPLVVTAHGRDVRNVGAYPGMRAATTTVVRRASRVIAVSDYLRRELEAKVPAARGKAVVIPSGVDVERFVPSPAPSSLRFLCIGSLTPRKNVVRLARAFEQLGEGTLAFVGDGPLRRELAGLPNVELLGTVPHEELPDQIAAARVVCQPSLIEPLGQALLEGMACGRAVVATRIGGPAEFVGPDAGVLVDPADEAALADGLRAAAALPCPNPAARSAAERLDVRRQAEQVEEVLREAARGRPA
jgi:glycosyltransferase involved in cell wall biosynthesis